MRKKGQSALGESPRTLFPSGDQEKPDEEKKAGHVRMEEKGRAIAQRKFAYANMREKKGIMPWEGKKENKSCSFGDSPPK